MSDFEIVSALKPPPIKTLEITPKQLGEFRTQITYYLRDDDPKGRPAEQIIKDLVYMLGTSMSCVYDYPLGYDVFEQYIARVLNESIANKKRIA